MPQWQLRSLRLLPGRGIEVMEYPAGAKKGRSGIRVRFAPSPTGPVHAGNIRTAIFNWLFARNTGGEFIIRIEDTDAERSKPEYAEQTVEALEWLGINWDEGPYYQSQHKALYKKVLEQLFNEGKIYPCFCSEELLAKDKADFERRSLPPVYTGRCRKIGSKEGMEKMKNEPYALRFKVEGDMLTYTDLVRGEIKVNLNLVGDFIVKRSTGGVTYNFAAGVDDSMMKISHVIRGEDHISNTPRQILVMNSIGHNPPSFAHLPLILSDEGKKLSKRDAGASFLELMDGGFMPDAVLNFLSLIGWNPEDGEEDMETKDIIRKFSLSRVAVRPAKYDITKLRWLNARKLRNAAPEAILRAGSSFIVKNKLYFKNLSTEKKHFLINAVKENLETLADLDSQLSIFFDYIMDDSALKEVSQFPVKEVLNSFLKFLTNEDFGEVTKQIKDNTGISGKKLFMPLRVALTGRLGGPELKHVYDWLPVEERLMRTNTLLGLLK